MAGAARAQGSAGRASIRGSQSNTNPQQPPCPPPPT